MKNVNSTVNLVVVNENILGYISHDAPNIVNVLKEDILRGGRFNPYNEPYVISKKDKIRLAVDKDYDEFHMTFKEHYEMNT